LLDLVVDFITYVFVPAAMLLRPEVMPHPYGLAAGLMITIGSALYFADTTMKTDDWWFRGFPAVWNVVVFYIVVFAPHVAVSMVIVVVATALMFLPVIFVHPVRVTRWRVLTMAMLGLWAVGAVGALLQRLTPDLWVKAALMVTLTYFVGLGVLRQPPTDAEPDPV
jgi:phosphatidylcholine synthase